MKRIIYDSVKENYIKKKGLDYFLNNLINCYITDNGLAYLKSGHAITIDISNYNKSDNGLDYFLNNLSKL